MHNHHVDTGALRWATAVFLVALSGLAYLVLRNFLVPLAWAGIVAYITWPVYRRLCAVLGARPTLAALIMTLALTFAIVAPFVATVSLMRDELSGSFHALADQLAHGPLQLPAPLASIPWVGPRLQQVLDQLGSDPHAAIQQLGQWAKPWTHELTSLVGDIGRNLLKMGIALLALFFVYLDGENIVEQVRQVLGRFLGVRGNAYLHATAATTRGVVYGVVLTALAQGVLAGLGYWVAGAPAPASFGALTAILAMVPFGAPLVWVPVGAWLLFGGSPWAGIGLLIWGGLVVSSIDNLLRPLAISSATRVPFLLVMLGVLGGLGSFGLVGLFLGPVILAVLLAVWREWLEEAVLQTPETAAEGALPVRVSERDEGN